MKYKNKHTPPSLGAEFTMKWNEGAAVPPAVLTVCRACSLYVWMIAECFACFRGVGGGDVSFFVSHIKIKEK